MSCQDDTYHLPNNSKAPEAGGKAEDERKSTKELDQDHGKAHDPEKADCASKISHSAFEAVTAKPAQQFLRSMWEQNDAQQYPGKERRPGLFVCLKYQMAHWKALIVIKEFFLYDL